MSFDLFDVVKLKNQNKATILTKPDNNKMFVEIIDNDGKKIENREITKDEIEKIIYKH